MAERVGRDGRIPELLVVPFKSLRQSNYLVRLHGFAEYSETMAPHRMNFIPGSLS